MKELIKILYEGNYSCVVESNNEIFTFSQRGIADLHDMVKNKPEVLKGLSLRIKLSVKAPSLKSANAHSNGYTVSG